MICRQTFYDAIIAGGCWVVGYYAVKFLGDGLSAKQAYGLIVGWWLTAYVSSRLTLSPGSAWVLGLAAFALFLFAAATGNDWFYREISSVDFGSVLLIGAVQALFYSSPIIFDWMVGRTFRRFSLGQRRKLQ